MSDHPSDLSLDIESIKQHKSKKTSFWSKLFGVETAEESDQNFEEKLIELIKDHDSNNKISGIEGRVLLHNILEFGSLTASDVMIPRSDIIAVSVDTPPENLLKFFVEEGHTRIPVYKGNLDNVLGFIHIKDLISILINKENFDVKKIIRPLIFAVPNLNIIDLMVKMRSARVHMALVLDEYGGIDGLLTIEDLLEQIVGNIEDEHDDNNEAKIIKVTDNIYEANSRISIEELENELGFNIFDGSQEDCETLGGLLFLLSGSVPSKGQVIDHPLGIKFEILEADPRNVKKARIVIPENIKVEDE